MRVALSKEWRKTAFWGILIPLALMIVEELINDWQDIIGLSIYMMGYIFVMIFFPAHLYSLIVFDKNVIFSRIHFIKQCEVDCLRPAQYMFFSEEIKGMSDERHYVLITNLQICFPIKRPYIDHFDRKKQIVIPYTKKTEKVLEKWFSCVHWTCVKGEKPDLDAPPPPPPPPTPPSPARPSKEASDEYNKGFRNYG